MSDRMTRIRNKTRELAPWFFIGAGGALIFFVARGAVQNANARTESLLAAHQAGYFEGVADRPLLGGEIKDSDRLDILVLEGVPAHEAGGGNDVYRDLDAPGVYYEVRAL